MFDDFFYHTPVQEPTWTGLPEPRRYQWAAFRFGIRDTQKFRWSKWNAKDFFPLDDLDGDFFSRFFCWTSFGLIIFPILLILILDDFGWVQFDDWKIET